MCGSTATSATPRERRRTGWTASAVCASKIPLGSRLILLGRGDVGAGGADLDWSASGDLAFRLGKGWVSGAGYRSLNVDYDKTGPLGILERTVWDIGYNGPRMWIVYTW
jgi:hypothetical protein